MDPKLLDSGGTGIMSIDTKIREEFPELSHIVHLNSAAISLMPREAKAAVAQAIRDREYTSEKRTEIRLRRELETRKKIAAMINAGTEEICMVSNTSEGLNIIAQGLNLSAGENVVLAETEFAGNVLPWLNLEKKGVRIKKASSGYGKDPADSILAAVDGKTRVVTVSFVGWIDGFRLNLTKIGEHCRERSIVFVVDAIQGIGAIELNVRSSHVSFLACGGQKWLMSPNGTGFIFVHKNLLPGIDLKYLGYLSVLSDPEAFDFRADLKGDATRFRLGSISDIGIAAMEKSVGLILGAEVKNTQTHVIELNRYAAEVLLKKGYELVSDLNPENMSGILTFRGRNTLEKYRELIQKGIIVSLRNGWIRISPHLYNNKEDIDKMLEAL
jgi:selenocysteine lyase/cysteine desulfurase